MNQLQEYISTYFGVDESHLHKISELFEEITLGKGVFFSKNGQYCHNLAFVKEGYFRVYLQTDKKEVTQWISSPGEFIADLRSLKFNQPARWNIEAITSSIIYTINEENYNKIGTLIPEWSELEKLFLAKCFLTLEDRVFSFISLSAEERYNLLFEHKKALFNQIPLHYIASMLGMTPETFSRIRKKSIS